MMGDQICFHKMLLLYMELITWSIQSIWVILHLTELLVLDS